MARIICFVCGSQGAEHRLRIKPCENEPYFPFLEHHDPPKGSRLPTKEGIVDSCRVCSAFLCQQWEAYERSHTPAIKRLYWLKRADNGHFTGAEMRLQGEYIAQIMGLQYQPGAFDGRSSPFDISRDSSIREVAPPPDNKPTENSKEKKNQQFNIAVQQKPSTGAFSHANVPMYSSVSRNLMMPQGQQMSGESALDLSVAKKEETSNMGDKRINFLCYLCAHQTSLHESQVVNSVRQAVNEPYFPVIQTLPCIHGAVPLNELGQARICVPCKNSLFQQWQAYEMSGIPTQHRNYKVYESPELKMLRATAAAHQTIDQMDLAHDRLEHVCYICGNIYQADLIRSLFTVPSSEPSMGTLFFPFVRELSRPSGAEPLRSDGSVLACRNCYEALYKQWQLQEIERVPLTQRQYSLSFLGAKGDANGSVLKVKQMKAEPVEKRTESPNPDLKKPLNIQISESGSEDQNTLLASQGLLAIASSSSSIPDDGPVAKSKSPFIVSKIPAIDSSTKTIPHPLQQATAIPKKICFLCGEKVRLSKAHILCSYPTRHEAKTLNSQVVPFFPFLANRDAAPKAEPMTEDGTVISCNVCFHILLQQWNDYEENKTGMDSNRWLRKYTLPDFVCCLCSKWMKHKNIQLLSCKMFPFLKDIKPGNSTGAPTIEDGHTVGACSNCAQTLFQQNVEYERMCVPLELRKFNWTRKPDQLESQDKEDSSDELGPNVSTEQEKTEVTAKDSTTEIQGFSEELTGTGQNVKPPPLNMLSGTKLSRNTATVPPLNQTSPSNGLTSISSNAALNATRTSSFAAALRKLAHQAKDPEESPSKHGSQPSSSSTSPRATTPKRGPPPLVYTSHSSLSSPPVVTIAPTQSHASMVSSDSRSLDRTHSIPGSSSAYEGLSSLKGDRPLSTQSAREEERYRPQSTHSNRDDDRLSSKDIATSRRTPLSSQSSTSPAVTREETLMRGFQPYRPGDDLRHSLPPFGLDSAAYPYPAFLPPHAFPHPAFRFDDPLLLERYRMMQPHYLPFAHPGLIPPPGGLNPFLAGRYPPELLHQQMPFVSQSSRLPDLSPSLVERQRLEEERMRDLEKEHREKEKEAILLREKERAREREKEYDKLRESMGNDYRSHHSTELRVPHHTDSRSSGVDLRTPHYSGDSKKSENKDRNHNERGPVSSDGIPKTGHKYGSITHGTPREFNLNEKSSRELQYNIDSDRYKSSRRDVSGKQGQHEVTKHSHHHHHHHDKGHDKKYSLLDSVHHSDKNRTPNENESKFHKSSDIFRPFDTSNLTNGYLSSRHSQDASIMHNTERSYDTTQGRVPIEVGENKSSALKHSVTMPTKPGNFNLNHVIDASKMHYKEHRTEHLQSSFERNRSLVVSSLDIGEDKLRQRRERGELSDDSEMDEIIEYLDESHRQSLMMVTKGPPLQLEVSKEKLRFLQQLGLTSQKVKRDLEYKKIRRRRRRLREPSVSPVLMVDGADKPISPSPKLDPEVLRHEPDYPKKCSFLGSFSLGTVESEKKKGSGVKRKHDKKSDDHSGKKVSRINKSDKVKLFPNKNVENTLSKEFAQEFHNSVLQSTQKHINGRLGLNTEQGDSSQSLKPTLSHDSSADSIPKWPGIDILMESYQKYQEEFKFERNMLKDRCRNLQNSNQDLNKKAEDLSRKMSESIEKKRQMDESRQKSQSAIESLKQILKDMK